MFCPRHAKEYQSVHICAQKSKNLVTTIDRRQWYTHNENTHNDTRYDTENTHNDTQAITLIHSVALNKPFLCHYL
jgi:hypothetical protein